MMDGDNDYGAVGGVDDWQGKPIYLKRSASVLLYPPQIP
jgi:hypothetical protein